MAKTPRRRRDGCCGLVVDDVEKVMMHEPSNQAKIIRRINRHALVCWYLVTWWQGLPLDAISFERHGGAVAHGEVLSWVMSLEGVDLLENVCSCLKYQKWLKITLHRYFSWKRESCIERLKVCNKTNLNIYVTKTSWCHCALFLFEPLLLFLLKLQSKRL